jgi:ADP-ribose pyrophosphatase YjhB (NUDIX family)
MNTNTKVIVGVVIEKNGKYLLVQEAKESCRGKWNLPAGHLDPGETMADGAKREAKEETGCEVELTGVCQIGSRVKENEVFASVIFTTKLMREEIEFDSAEILDVKWFSYEEILVMRSKIRNEGLLIGAIENARNGVVAPMEIVGQFEG